MSSETGTVYWTHGKENQPLAGLVDALCEQLEKINYCYLEWRPGAGLLNSEVGPAPVLLEGKPEHNDRIALDELRLFGTGCGLHAIEDAGTTRWMQWQVFASGVASVEQNGQQESITKLVEYPICMLDSESAVRFGFSVEQAMKTQMRVHEYRSGGELFCWNLVGEAK